MNKVYGNMMEMTASYAVMFIPTNGYVKADGRNVMGAGLAKTMRDQHGMDIKLGECIRKNGNVVQAISIEKINGKNIIIGSFPTKPVMGTEADLLPRFKGKNMQPMGWACNNTLAIIKKSVAELLVLIKEVHAVNPNARFLVPRPRCGNGGLKWEDVEPLLEVLPDSVDVCKFKRTSKPTVSAYTRKDIIKFQICDSIISQGAPGSSSDKYGEGALGIPANVQPRPNSIVGVSVNGRRKGRLTFDKTLVNAAIGRSVQFVTDNYANRHRDFNVGEREVARYLYINGYTPTEHDTRAIWTRQ